MPSSLLRTARRLAHPLHHASHTAGRHLARAGAGALLAGLAACATEQPTAISIAPPAAPRALKVSTFSAGQVSAGQSHACAVQSDGSLVCWGQNDAGQASPPSGTGFTQVTTSAKHSCGLRTDGSITCWGDSDGGRTAAPTGTGFRSIDAGQDYTCAVAGDGSLTCWGVHTGPDDRAGPPGGTNYTQVSAGYWSACALRTDGSIACWGDDAYGEATPPAGTGFTQVSVGTQFACALRSNGSVICWGENSSVQASPPTESDFTQVTAGDTRGCALRTDGSAVCWGNDFGSLTPPAGATFVQISAGTAFTCGVTRDASVLCWGTNSYGKTNPPSKHVAPVATFAAPASAAAGQPFALALTGAQVPGYLSATTFTYAFDCGDGQGYASASAIATASCPTTAAGPRTVRGEVIDQDGDTASYAASLIVTGTQTVAFTTAAPSPAYVGALYIANAAATSGRLPSLSVLTPTTCTILPSTNPLAPPLPVTVILTNVGACTLAADEGGDATYAPAPRATQTIAVTLRPQAITFTSTPPSPARVGGTYTVAATGGASGNPVTISLLTPATCTVAGSTVRFVAVGQCTVAADQTGTAAYAAATRVTQTVTIASLPQTITFTSAPPTPARVGGTYTVGATVSSYFTPAYSSLTPAACTVATAYVGAPTATVTFTAAGTCVVAADESASGPYAAAPEVTQTISVLAALPSFPVTAVLDGFNRADGALGSNWGGFAAPAFFRVSQQHGAVALGGGIGWAPNAFGTTQEAFVTLTGLGGNGGSGAQGLVLKGQDPRDHTLGAITVTYAPRQGTVTVATLHAPPGAGAAYPALAVRFAAGDQLGARVTAAGVVTVYQNGTLVGTVTLGAADQAYFATRGGYIGLVDVAAPGAQFDDFGGGSVTP